MSTQDFRTAATDISQGLKSYPVWSYMARHDVFAKYRRSLLGPIWVSGSIIATSLALSLVMGGIFHAKLADVLPYIMSGILCWGIVGLVFTEGPETFLQSSNIIRSHPFPFTVYIMRMITRNAFVFAHSIVVYLIIVLVVRHSLAIHWELLFGVPLIFVFGAFSSAISGLAAARFRDLRFLMPYLGQLMFFVTPIFWHADQVGRMRGLLVQYNPFYYLITVAREPLLGHAVPPNIWITAVIITLALAAIFFVAFAYTRRRITFWV